MTYLPIFRIQHPTSKNIRPRRSLSKKQFYHNAVRTKSGKYLLIESFDENRLVTVNGKTCNVYKTYPNISGEGTEKDAAIFRYASKMAIKETTAVLLSELTSAVYWTFCK